MSPKNPIIKNIIFNIIKILSLFNFFIKVSSLTCKINVPNDITTQKLDNIICIGDSGFSYSNFAMFSDGSIIIESSKDSSEERVFYGIT